MAARSANPSHIDPALLAFGLLLAAGAVTVGAMLLSRNVREVPLSPTQQVELTAAPATALPSDPAATAAPGFPAQLTVPEASLPVVPAEQGGPSAATPAPRTSFDPARPSPAAPGAPYKDYTTDPGNGETKPGY
jgi:hypothetical protein